MLTCAVRSSEDSPYCRGSARAYALQRGIPSPRGSVTTRSHDILAQVLQNIKRIRITCHFLVRHRYRLTLNRLAWFRKPWVFGVNISIFIVVTHAYIFVSGRSREPRDSPSTPTGMLPYHATLRRVLGFGDGLDARSSSMQLRSTSELLRTL